MKYLNLGHMVAEFRRFIQTNIDKNKILAWWLERTIIHCVIMGTNESCLESGGINIGKSGLNPIVTNF